MKISEQRDSARAFMTQAKGISKQRKQKDAAAIMEKKKMNLAALSTVLFDSLESYDQVLSCASKGKLKFCSVPELHSVLKVNGFQFFRLTKDYIEKNFSILSGVLFQTRFSSLVAGNTVITAVALEDSEVVQDLAALQWLDGASGDLVQLSPEEGTSLAEWQPNCVATVTLDGLADDLVGSAAAISSLNTFQAANSPIEGPMDLVDLSVDDCYRPDMSMIVMLESIQAQSSSSMYSPDQRSVLCSQEEIITNGPVSQPESKLLIEPSMPLFCFEARPPHLSPTFASHNNTGSASQEEHLTQSIHTCFANVEISYARTKLESEEEDIIEKFPPFICQTLESSSSIMCGLPFINGAIMKIADQNHRTLPQRAKTHVIFEPEAEQLTQPNYEEVSEVQEQSSYSSVSSPGPVEEPAQPSPPLLDSDHSAIESQEICQPEVKSESKEEFDLVEKFAKEALELKEDDLSDTQLLDETASEGNMRVVANVHDFVKLEEDQCSNSCQIQEVHLNSPLCVVPSPQQTSSTEGNFVGFLGLLAQVSTGHSKELNCTNCSLEGEHAMFNSEARSCAKRLFMENEAERSVEGEAAKFPERKTKKMEQYIAFEA